MTDGAENAAMTAIVTENHSTADRTTAHMYDTRRKRWACGSCTQCTAEDCGECINCRDKMRFGGLGVRKQSCVMRRCVRMSSNGSTHSSAGSSVGSSSVCSEDGSFTDRRVSQKTAASSNEHTLFWAAVSGCMALNGPSKGGGSDDDGTASTPYSSPCGTRSASPANSVGSERSLGACGATGVNSFCFKLAAVLVRSRA